MRFFSPNRKTIPLLAVLVSAAVLISCTGRVKKPEDVIDRMIKAYGGREKTALLGNFVGHGFMKDQFSPAVTRGWPYDIWQRGTRLKSKMVILDKGIVKNIRYSLHDSLGTYRVSKRFDRFYPSPAELELLKYRFPNILQWVQGDTLRANLIDDGGENGICKLEFFDGSRRIEIGVERNTWLLHDISSQLQSDTTKVFEETYTDYWKVDGIPVPARYAATLNGGTYYEYFLVAVEIGMELPDSVFSITEDERAEILTFE